MVDRKNSRTIMKNREKMKGKMMETGMKTWMKIKGMTMTKRMAPMMRSSKIELMKGWNKRRKMKKIIPNKIKDRI